MNDALTGLYNRSTFFDLLKKAVHDAVELSAPVGLLIVDVRRFHIVNKNFGHDAGDMVLQAVTGVLKTVCREDDYLFRIGDDQFAMLLSRVANIGHARLAATKILRLMDVPIMLEAREIRCAAAVGIALCPYNAAEATELLQSAERALEQAKHLDPAVGFFEKKEEERISQDWDIELMLGEAIANSELRVFFQPKISLDTGKPVGAEALVRWENAMRGMISPAAFLPVAESIGFLTPLTIWMLNSALRLSSGWTRKWGRLSVSVNIPPSMLEQADFVDLVISAERLWQRDNVDLCLEVVEQSLVSNVEVAFRKLNSLREQGVKISIDDFGTGYSSLSYFRDIPADELKIDQSFVKDLLSDEGNIHIVSLIIDIAHRFGLQVIAEGVEERDVLMYLKNKTCDQAQGYYFAKPMPAEAFSAWLLTYEVETDLTRMALT